MERLKQQVASHKFLQFFIGTFNLQLQSSTQAIGSDPMRAYNPSDNDTGFSHVNDLYKTALDDNEVSLISRPSCFSMSHFLCETLKSSREGRGMRLNEVVPDYA